MNDIETALFLIACPYSIVSKVFIFVAPKLLVFFGIFNAIFSDFAKFS